MPTPKASPQNRSTNGKGKYQSPLHGAPDEGKPQKVVTASQYKELKRRAFNFEKTNSDSIIIFPTKGDGTWYRMGGTSALLYMNFVMRPLHLSATYRDDTDYHYIFDLGTITVRNLDLIKKRIERAGVLKEMTSGGGSYRFKLNFSVTAKEILELRQEEVFRRENLAKIIEPVFMNPELYVALSHITKRVTEMASKRQDHFARSVYGREMVACANSLFENYLMMTNLPNGNDIKKWKSLRKIAILLAVKLQIVAELRLWPPDKCAVIGKEAIEIKRQIDLQIANLIKDQPSEAPPQA